MANTDTYESGRELTAEQAEAFLRDEVARHLAMTLEDFRVRAEQGDLPDDPSVVHLALLAGVRLHSC